MNDLVHCEKMFISVYAWLEVFRQPFTSLMHNIYETEKDLHFNIHGFDQVKAECDLETHIIWVI